MPLFEFSLYYLHSSYFNFLSVFKEGTIFIIGNRTGGVCVFLCGALFFTSRHSVFASASCNLSFLCQFGKLCYHSSVTKFPSGFYISDFKVFHSASLGIYLI